MLTSTAFWASAGERAIKTVAQTALALLGTSQLVSVVNVDWAEIGGVSVLAGILSLLTSIALPSAETKHAIRAEALVAAEAARVAAAKTAKPATKRVVKK
jgi:hypothetical protein